MKEVVQRTGVVSHGAGGAGKWRIYWEFISGSIMHRGGAGRAKESKSSIADSDIGRRSLDLRPPSCQTSGGQKSSPNGQSSRRCVRPRHNARPRLSVAHLSYALQFSVSPRVGSLISIFKGRTPPPKPDERDLDEYLTKIIGPPRVDTGELSPSIPGTPSFSSIPIPPGTSYSGRASRQSNEGSDRQDSSFGRYTNSGTDHAVDRCVPLSLPRYPCLIDATPAL